MEKRIVKIGRTKIRVYPRHSAGCDQRSECKCIRWMQYQNHGKQVRETTSQWTWERAVKTAEARARELEELDDKQAIGITIQSAVDDWLSWREKENRSNEKPRMMTKKLLEWSSKRGIFLLHEIKKADLVAWRLRWKYRSGDSSSMKVHWSVLSSFFSFCIGADLLKENPVPKGPQFVIRYRRRPVVPISNVELDTLIARSDSIEGWDSEQKQRMRALAGC